MKIKTIGGDTILRNLYWLGGALAVVVLLVALVGSPPEKPAEKNEPTHILSRATSVFIKKEVSLPELLDFFQEHTILLGVKDDASVNMNQKMRERLSEIGGEELAQIGLRESYAGIIENGKITEEYRNKKGEAILENDSLKVASGGFDHGNFCHFHFDGHITDAPKRGLNVFVLSKTGRPIGVWSFDFFAKENPKSKVERNGAFLFMGVPLIEIELKGKHFAKLKKKRDEALETKVLLTEDDDLVPARILFKGKELKSEIRLKGDWTDHLAGDNWSFRVKLDKENTLMGMRKFSLHRPESRNYQGEWLFHQLLADADIPNLQYHFVQVQLNVSGDDGVEEKLLGLYALEEFFDKQLIERCQRREGVILKIDEDPIWQERAEFFSRGLDLGDFALMGYAKYENLNILPFGENRVRQDSSLLRQFLTGAKLFRDFVSGERAIHEVFDVEKLAMYNAICNLLGANHALIPHNYRVYYNPVTSRLEPVGFDANAWHKVWYFYRYLHADDDPVFMAAYAQALERVSSDEYFEKVINWPGLENQSALMEEAFPKMELTLEMLRKNQQLIQKKLHPENSLNVHFDRFEKNQIHLTIQNFGKFPVQVSGIQNIGGRKFGQPTDNGIINPNERRSVVFNLDKNYNRLFVQKGKKKSGFQASEDVAGLKIQYNLLGINELIKEDILPWNEDLAYDKDDDPFRNTPNANYFEWLEFDEDKKTITCRPGLHRLGAPLIIPEGYVVQAGPDCRIELVFNNSKIISYSPFEFIGSEESPVEIFTSTGEGRGILITNAADTSIFKYCRFNGLSNPFASGWALTGAINFYESPVKLSHCVFSKNRCEDALNIFRSWFDMDEVMFTDIHADAFDGDFVKGTVRNCQFGQIGNDAIDVSGSDILVENVGIVEAGDKGLSAGENSKLVARQVVVRKSEIAIASKDQSFLQISNSILGDNALVFTAFQKKPEFGPAQIEATGLTMRGNKQEFLIETNSSLLLDGQFMPTEDGVIERMYGEEFGRKSER